MESKFQQLRNDLFWYFYDWDDEGKKYSWQGYNDAYWWKNVATSDQWQIRGKYRLNPFTNELSLVEVKDEV